METQIVTDKNLLALLPQNQLILKQVNDWKFGDICQKFSEECPQFDLDQTFAEYKYYMYLCKAEFAAGTSKLPIPNERCDEFWHRHILFLEDYIAFCNYLGSGELIMHYPHTRNHPRLEYDAKRELLKPLQLQHFGMEVFDMGQELATSYSGC